MQKVQYDAAKVAEVKANEMKIKDSICVIYINLSVSKKVFLKMVKCYAI